MRILPGEQWYKFLCHMSNFWESEKFRLSSMGFQGNLFHGLNLHAASHLRFWIVQLEGRLQNDDLQCYFTIGLWTSKVIMRNRKVLNVIKVTLISVGKSKAHQSMQCFIWLTLPKSDHANVPFVEFSSLWIANLVVKKFPRLTYFGEAITSQSIFYSCKLWFKTIQ